MTDPAYATLGPTPRPGRFRALPRPARNAAFALVAETGSKLTTFLWTVVAARELSQADFGTLNFALSLALILAAVAEWGFDPVMIQRTAREPELGERFFVHAVTWEAIVATVLFAGTAAAVVTFSTGTAQVVVLLVLLAIYLDVFADTMRGMGTALQRQGVTSVALLVQRVAIAAFVVPVLLAGGGLTAFGVAFLAGYIVGYGAHLVALHRLGIRLRPGLVDRTGMRSFMKGTTAIALSGLVLAALFRVDALMLAAFEGPVAVGTYAAAYRLFETTLFVAFAVNGALFPLMSERGDDGVQVRAVLEKAIGAMFLLYLPYAVICIIDANAVLSLLFGADYGASSSTALVLLAPAPAFYAMAFATGSALTAMRRTGGLLVAAIAATVLNVGLNLVLIPTISIDGAALATTVAYLTEATVLLVYVTRITGGPPRFARAALPAFAASVPLAGVLLAAPIHPFAAMAIGLPIYVVGWWLVARRFAPWQVDFLRVLLRRPPAH